MDPLHNRRRVNGAQEQAADQQEDHCHRSRTSFAHLRETHLLGTVIGINGTSDTAAIVTDTTDHRDGRLCRLDAMWAWAWAMTGMVLRMDAHPCRRDGTVAMTIIAATARMDTTDTMGTMARHADRHPDAMPPA
jgi:hypothetical protein